MEALIDRRMEAAVFCDECGYDLRGLPEMARCPECGGTFPQRERRTGGAGAVWLTHGEITWMRSVAAGLALLIVCSLFSAQVAMVMRIEYHAAAAMNAPCPKIWAGPMLQRQLGGQPGPWGVQAWLAALGSALGIWLITWPRTRQGDGLFSLASAARWSAVLGLGMTMGGMLALSLPHNSIWGGGAESRQMLALALLIGEAPAGFFLYRYLHRLAMQIDARAAAAMLRPAMVLVPASALCAGGFLLVPWDISHSSQLLWRAIFVTATAAMVAAGVVATAGVLRLSALLISATASTWLRRRRAARRTMSQWLDALRTTIDRRAARYAVAAGLVLLLCTTFSSAHAALGMYPSRKALGGDVPLVGFIGPKISIAQLYMAPSWEPSSYRTTAPLFMMLIALWLITTRLPNQHSPLRRVARYLPLVLSATGAAAVGQLDAGFSRSVVIAGMVAGIEVPCTLLLFLYLAQLAGHMREPPIRVKRLRWLGVAAALLLLAPLTALPMSLPLAAQRESLLVTGLSSLYLAVALAVTFLAGTALVQLAWGLLAEYQSSNEHCLCSAR